MQFWGPSDKEHDGLRQLSCAVDALDLDRLLLCRLPNGCLRQGCVLACRIGHAQFWYAHGGQRLQCMGDLGPQVGKDIENSVCRFFLHGLVQPRGNQGQWGGCFAR